MTWPTFAFIFRPTGPVAAEDLPKRNAAARAWALARRREGSLRAASPLEEEGARVTRAGVTPLRDVHPVAAILVIEAADLAAATALAEGHPGLAYGTEIEVRPVKQVNLPPEE